MAIVNGANYDHADVQSVVGGNALSDADAEALYNELLGGE